MADPTKYERDYSFGNYQANQPSRPLPGVEVDLELDNIAGALGGAIDAIKDIRRSDGALKNGIVTPESLSSNFAVTVLPEFTDLIDRAETAAETAEADADRAEAAALALGGLTQRVAVQITTAPGQQTYDIGFDPGDDMLDVVLNTASLASGVHYTRVGSALTLTAPIVQGGDLLVIKSAVLGAVVGGDTAAVRTALRLIVTSDWQPQIGDPDLADYLTDPWEGRDLFRDMLEEMKGSFGQYVHGIIHTGDVVHRANLSGADATFFTGLLGGTFSAGDPYPYGYEPLLADLQTYGGFPPERFFPLAGNHDVNARGLGEHKGAWTFETFRETFGEWNYVVRFGNIGFIFLSDNSAGVGGQIPASAIEWARGVLADKPHVLWHLCIHQPILGRGPSPGFVTNTAFTATGGETTITIGDYANGSPQALQVYLGGYPSGTLLTPADYDSDGNVTNPRDYQYVYVDPGDPGDAQPPMTQIVLTVPATAAQVYQARIADVDNNQDTFTSTRLEALLSEHQDRIFAVFYGHRGSLQSSTQTNILEDERGIYHVNNNMSLPDRLVAGVNATTAPLVYSVAEWNAGTNTLTLRRWNSTAGDWLENTHPAADHTLSITYPRQIDLGVNLPDYDGRKDTGEGPATTREWLVTRDIYERDVLDGDEWQTDVAGKLRIGKIELTDKGLRNVQAGDGVQVEVWIPSGVSNASGGRVAWVDEPSRYAMRYGWETATGSDSVGRAKHYIEARDDADTWRRIFEADGDKGVAAFPSGIAPTEVRIEGISSSVSGPVGPQFGFGLTWFEGVRDLQIGEGLTFDWRVQLFDDDDPETVVRWETRKKYTRDTDDFGSSGEGARTSTLHLKVSDDGTTAGLRDVLVVNPETGRLALPFGIEGFPHTIYASAVTVPHTGTVAKTAIATIPIPLGALGPNGWLTVDIEVTTPDNTTDNKVLTIEYGGTVVHETAADSLDNTRNYGQQIIIQNQDNEASQYFRATGAANPFGASTSTGPTTATVNSAVPQNLVVSFTIADATDTLNLRRLAVSATYMP